MSPVATALGEVNNAAKTLRSMSQRRPGQAVECACYFVTGGLWLIVFSVKQLGNAVNGAVDSPVSGGVKLYRSV